jgi:hypothetical protein
MKPSASPTQHFYSVVAGKFAIGFLALASLLLLSSCAINQGNAKITDSGSYSATVRGKSTKKDVHRAFGQPHDVKYNGSACEWTYYHLNSVTHPASLVPVLGLVVGGANDTITTAKFTFNGSGTLTDHSDSQEKKFTNDWTAIAQGSASHLSNVQADRVKAEMGKLGLSFDKVEARKARDIGTSIGVQR